MRWFLVLVFWTVLLSGCVKPVSPNFSPAAGPAPGEPARNAPNVATNITYIPIVAITGRVVMSNPKAQFVILSLGPGIFPPKGTRLFVYRKEAKVAELRISGSQWDDKTVADILKGDPQVNDQVSDN